MARPRSPSPTTPTKSPLCLVMATFLEGGSAADVDLLAGDRGGVRGKQERDEGRNLFGTDTPADGRQRGGGRARALRIVEHRGVGAGRRDHVHGNPARSKLLGPGSGEPDERRLGGGVLAFLRRAKAGAAAYQDDTSTGAHPGREMVGERGCGLHV